MDTEQRELVQLRAAYSALEELLEVQERCVKEQSEEMARLMKDLMQQRDELAHTNAALSRENIARKQAERLQSAQYAVSQALDEPASMREAMPHILRAICNEMEWDIGQIWFLGQGDTVLCCETTWHRPSVSCETFEAQSREMTLGLGVGLPGRVWAHGKPDWIADVTQDINFPRGWAARQSGLHGAFAFPIKNGGSTLGIIEFFSRNIRQPDHELLRMAEEIGIKVGHFIERQQAQDGLRKAKETADQSAKSKAMILATVPAFFIGVDERGMVTEWTVTAERLFGISLCDAVGHSFVTLPINWNWDAITAARHTCQETLQKVTLESVRMKSWRGQDLFLKLTVNAVLADTTIGVVFMGEDVTESLRMERELAQAQKLESIGQLAAGIAHEINTPTQYIGDNIRFLRDAYEDVKGLISHCRVLAEAVKTEADRSAVEGLAMQYAAFAEKADIGYLMKEIPSAIRQSLEGIEHVSRIVRSMKEFAHPDTGEKVPTDLNKAIETTITVARNEWKYVAEVVTDFDAELPSVPCFAGGFNQVILNLIVNAAHAIQDVVGKEGHGKGTITVRTRRMDDWVEVRIGDTGTGIPEENRGKIFDPFFTTKEVGRGTGQGLAIAHTVVVEKHEGTIELESELGKGTTFILRLPLGVPSTMGAH